MFSCCSAATAFFNVFSGSCSSTAACLGAATGHYCCRPSNHLPLLRESVEIASVVDDAVVFGGGFGKTAA